MSGTDQRAYPQHDDRIAIRSIADRPTYQVDLEAPPVLDLDEFVGQVASRWIEHHLRQNDILSVYGSTATISHSINSIRIRPFPVLAATPTLRTAPGR